MSFSMQPCTFWKNASSYPPQVLQPWPARMMAKSMPAALTFAQSMVSFHSETSMPIPLAPLTVTPLLPM